LVAVAVSTNQINLSWIDRSSIETGFKIERAPDAAGSPGTWTQIATVGANVTTYTNAGLSANTKYWYRVRAYRGSSNSAYSNQANATTFPPPPAAPSGLTATAVSTNQINLAWADNSNVEDGFKIERAPDNAGSPGVWAQIGAAATNITGYADTGLSVNTKYWYRVRAYNAGGESGYSDLASDTTFGIGVLVVTPPDGLVSSGYVGGPFSPNNKVYMLTNSGDGPLSWLSGYGPSWASASPAGGILAAGEATSVIVSINSNANSLAGNIEYATSLTFTNLTNNNGTIWRSLTLTVLLYPPPPAAPSGLTVVGVASNEFLISWQDNSYNEDGFKIERAPDNAGSPGAWSQIANASANVTTYSDTTVSAGTRYWYRARAYNAGGNSGYSNPAIACPIEDLVRITSQPTSQTACSEGTASFSVTATGASLTYRWRRNGTNLVDGADITGTTTPVLTLSNLANACVTLSNDCVTWGNVIAGRTYRYQASGCMQISLGYQRLVLFFDPDGNGHPDPTCWGSPTNFTARQIATCPGLRTGSLVGKIGDTCIQLGSGGSFVAPASGPLTLCVNNDVSIEYSGGWNVCISSAGGPGAYDVVVAGACGMQTSAVATLTVVPPAATPTALGATAVSSNQIDLAWTANGLPDSFTVERAPDTSGIPGSWTEIVTVDSNVTAYSDIGVPSDTRFWYRVRAHNVCGDTPYSNQANATAPSQPGAPSNLMATATSESGIDLTWNDNSNDEYGFLIERAPDNSGVPGAWSLISTAAVNAVSYSDNGLTPITKYWYRVRAYNVGGYSDYSEEASATTPLMTAPSGLYAMALSTNTIQLGWNDNSANEDGFKIERALDDGGGPGAWTQIATVSTNVTVYSDTGLVDGTKYWYRVRVFNALGDSDYSDLINVTIPLSPFAPSALTAAPLSGSQINLAWADNSSNETGFAVERAPDSAGVPGTWAQIATRNANVSAYTNTGLTANTIYWYRVRAYNGVSYSAYCDPASAMTLANLSNSWISASNGKWETGSSWSLGVAPSVFLLGTLITNDNSKIVTIDTSTVSNYPSTMTISNLTVAAPPGATNTLLLTTAGTNTPLHVVQVASIGSGGVVDLDNSSLQMDYFNSKSSFTIDGALFCRNGSQVRLGTRSIEASSFMVGNVATGLMVLSAGTLSAGNGTIGFAAGSQGTLVISNGATARVSALSIGQLTNSSGTVWMSGGELTTTNGGQPNVLYVGFMGRGQMTVSNGTVMSGRAYVGMGSVQGGNFPAAGALTMAGGSVTISSSLYVGNGVQATGVVSLVGGQLIVTNGNTIIAASGIGQLTVAAGEMKASSMIVGQNAGSQGSLIVSGGTVSVWSSLVIGDCTTSASGQVIVAGVGSLFVTNFTHTAFLDLRNGMLLVDSGAVLQVDKLVMTNSCGLLVRKGGTLMVNNLVLDPNLSAIGDGIPNGWKQQYGFDALDPAVADADSDGDGMSNLQEFQAGTDPTNSASAFRILEVAPADEDMLITWEAVGGKWYIVQTATNLTGGLSNSFYDLNPVILAPGANEYPLSVIHMGAATNAPARFYRVRLVP
jgi:titin